MLFISDKSEVYAQNKSRFLKLKSTDFENSETSPWYLREYFAWREKSAHCGPKAKFSSSPAFVNSVLLEQAHAHLFVHVLHMVAFRVQQQSIHKDNI